MTTNNEPSFLYEAEPGVWDGTLGERMLEALDSGRLLNWLSVSGASVLIARTKQGLVRIRNNRWDPFITDGVPFQLGP